MLTCKICERECPSLKGLTTHITMTHIKKGHIGSQEAYYKKYIKDEEGFCLVCGAPTKFDNVGTGYL